MCKSKRNISSKIIYLVIITHTHTHKDICVISYLSKNFVGLHSAGTSSLALPPLAKQGHSPPHGDQICPRPRLGCRLSPWILALMGIFAIPSWNWTLKIFNLMHDPFVSANHLESWKDTYRVACPSLLIRCKISNMVKE